MQDESNWSGAQRKSPRRRGTCVTRRSIRRSATAGKGDLSRSLTKKLRTGRPLRKCRRSPTARSPRFLALARLIDARPAVVEERSRIGDWEGDPIVGRASRSAIGTLVDRRTGYLGPVHLPTATPPSGSRRDAPRSRRAAGAGPADADLGSGPGGVRTTCSPNTSSTASSSPIPPARGWRHEREHQRAAPSVLPEGSDLWRYTADELRVVERRLNERLESSSAGRAPPVPWSSSWHSDGVSVATTTRIRPSEIVGHGRCNPHLRPALPGVAVRWRR